MNGVFKLGWRHCRQASMLLGLLGASAGPAYAALAADLALSMSASPTTVAAQGTITYTITVSNIDKLSLVCSFDPVTRRRVCDLVDSADANGVRVVDAVPTTVKSVSNTGNFACSASGNVVTCSGGTLVAGDSATITIQATAPNAAAALTNSASVSFAAAGTPERDMTNNSATTVVSVQAPVVGSPPNPLQASIISAGNYHTCVTRPSGGTYCWGWNNVGQVGVGSTAVCPARSTGAASCVPRPSFVMNAARSQAGIDHTCALDATGKAWCWGNNVGPALGYGQGGVPSLSQLWSPTAVSSSRVFSSISAGQYSTCAVSAGTVFCWGAVDGSLGVGATWQPTALAAFAPFQDVAVGYLHACALFVSGSTGQASCVGNNTFGQVAENPGQVSNASIVDINLFPTNIARLVSKVNTTCAELQNGTVTCAGDNGWGQLGNGGFTSTFVPQLVGGGQPLHGVSVGANHACAIDPTGQAWCWGNGNWGEFGDGTTRVSATPVPAGGSRTYIAIAAGFQHTCAIGTDDQVYCWGRNYEGELGVGSIGGWTSTPMATIAVPM